MRQGCRWTPGTGSCRGDELVCLPGETGSCPGPKVTTAVRLPSHSGRVADTEHQRTEVTVIGVVVAEDNPGVRDALIALLESVPDLTVLGQCEDGDEVLPMVERTDPQVVVVDVGMPRVDGLEATRRVMAARPGSRVLVLTASLSDALVREAHRSGAVGYQLKGDDPGELLAAIRAVARGETAWSSPAAACLPVD